MKTINVLETASKWFYEAEHARWNDSMGGGYGQYDGGYSRAARLLLAEADLLDEAERLEEEAKKAHKEWEDEYYRKQREKSPIDITVFR